MKSIFALLFVCLALTEFSTVNGAVTEASIREAAQYCEAEVPRYCISTTCPNFCNSLVSRTQKAKCNGECTATQRCSFTPLPTPNRRGVSNEALEGQNRDQLAACIAERRDPNNTKTGRRTVPWRDLRTNSYLRATRP